MKRFILFALATLLYTSSAAALPIEIVSETHRVWGKAGYPDNSYCPDCIYAEYDLLTVNQPVSADVVGAYNSSPSYLEPSRSFASAGNFEIETVAGRWAANAHGESTYIFMTENFSLNLSASGYTGHNLPRDVVSFSLRDITTNLLLIEYSFTTSWDYDTWSPIYSFSFFDTLITDPSHVYELSMYAQATEGDSPNSSYLNLNFSAQPVPEPTTILLIIPGIAAYLICGRKASKLSKN